MTQDFPDMTPPPPMPVIDYDTPRADQVPRRRFMIVLALGLALFGILLGLLMMRVVARPAAMVKVATPVPVITVPAMQATLQQQVADSRRRNQEERLDDLLTSTLPSSQIVYEEEPVAAKRLREAGNNGGIINQQAERQNMSQPLWGSFEPPAYRASGFWENGVSNESKDALLFAHQLTSPGGNVRLVLLEMQVTLHAGSAPKDEFFVAIDRRLKYRICDTKLFVNSPKVLRDGTSLKIEQADDRNVIPIKWVDGTLRAARPAELNLRFFAGQTDPKDLSHFTVDYELGGVKNTIDGYLTDDDFLRIIPKGGKVEQAKWLIDQSK